ncbi:MAG TPA: TonB-dependent receptor [Candidatus Didemnitutus sp.]|nr:TonB-dependent receptor [Candidatus Didemnitutus sp.]
MSPRTRFHPSSRLLGAVAGAAALLASALPLAAQDAPTPPKAADDKVVKLDTFEVHGYRQSLAASLDDKRKADSIVDVISAEDVGKFPDTNLAESLSHLPGVTIDRLFGEGERVSILGTDPSLNRTLLNGEPIATADWYILDTPSRQFNYVLLAPEVIGKAEVYRTWEPRLLEGSIGGTIIVNTLDPLAGRPLSVAASVTDSYNGLSKRYEPSYSAQVSWRNDAKTLGFLLGGEDQKDYIRRDGVEALGILGNYTGNNGIVVQNTFGPGTGLPQAGTPTQAATGPGNFGVDEVVNTALFEQLRHRQGANGAFVYSPSEHFKLTLNALYVDENMDNTNSSFYPMYMAGGTFSNATFANGILTGMNVTGNQLEMDLFARKAEIKTQDYSAKAEISGDNYKLTGNVGYTRATGGTSMQAYRGVNAFDNYSISEGSNFASYNVTPASSQATYQQTADIAGPSNNGWGGLVEEPEKDEEKWAQVDFELPLKQGFLNKLLFGMRSSIHNTSQSSAHQVALFGPGERNYLALLTPAPSNFLSGLPGITQTMATHPVGTNFAAIFNQVANTPASQTDVDSTYWPGIVVGETLSQYAKTHPYAVVNDWLAIPTDSATVGPTFDAEEDINAMYVQTQFSDGKLSGNFGVRLVQTTTTGTSTNVGRISGSPYAGALPGGEPLTAASLGQYGAPGYQPIPTPGPGQTQAQANMAAWTQAQYDATEVPVTGHVNDTYVSVLPALNIAYDLGRDQVLRFAVAEVMARPNLLQEFGYTTLYPINTPGDIGGNGVGGTTGLDPYKSINTDVAYDWYFAKNSYFSVDLFYKDIENYIINVTQPEVHANTTTWEDQYFYVTRPQNGGKASSKGIALSYQQEFTSGFGLQANYTHMNASGQTGTLPFASKNQINIGPYFENHFGLFRLTYTWRDDFATGSFNGSSTVFTRPLTELDANASISLTKNLSLVITARNLTNETYQQYFTVPNGAKLFADAYKTGRMYTAGIHFAF